MDTLSERQKFCLSQKEKCPDINSMDHYKWIFKGQRFSGNCEFLKHGFGYEKIDGKWELIPHTGKIVIGDDVHIHSGTKVVCATADDGETRIGNGTKIDTLCHIAHNVHIGERCLITSGVIIGGSTIIEDDVYIGIGAIIRNKIKIGKGAVIGMGAVVTKDVPAGVTVIGNPAKEKDPNNYW